MLVWLASYPRSGNSFVRILLHRLYGLQSDTLYASEDNETTRTMNGLVGQELSALTLEDRISSPDPHFVKTHDLPQEDCYSAIYIVRDGRDALVSYAHFILSTEHQTDHTRDPGLFRRILHALIAQDDHFAGWSANVSAWASRRAPTAIIRYEDLLAEPAEQLHAALEKLRLRMRPLQPANLPEFGELHRVFPWFFRNGRAGGWRSEMPPDLHELFWDRHADAMQLMNYGPRPKPPGPPEACSGFSHFFSQHYAAHNQARLEHLASLGIALESRSVLELGAGIGDHTQFFIDRHCRLLATDVRPECLAFLRRRFSGLETASIDMNRPGNLARFGKFQIVHCYGLLYHLENPAEAIRAMANVCSETLLLETCVSPDSGATLAFTNENNLDPTQSITGRGCRPSRSWIIRELQNGFRYVYQTRTQPNHPEFPQDWREPHTPDGLRRAVFVASRTRLELASLGARLLAKQARLIIER